MHARSATTKPADHPADHPRTAPDANVNG